MAIETVRKTMSDIVEYDGATGELTERDYTPNELAQHETDQEAAAQRATADAATEATRLATIQAARAHAASLGFTDAMLAVMYPNLTP